MKRRAKESSWYVQETVTVRTRIWPEKGSPSKSEELRAAVDLARAFTYRVTRNARITAVMIETVRKID